MMFFELHLLSNPLQNHQLFQPQEFGCLLINGWLSERAKAYQTSLFKAFEVVVHFLFVAHSAKNFRAAFLRSVLVGPGFAFLVMATMGLKGPSLGKQHP